MAIEIPKSLSSPTACIGETADTSNGQHEHGSLPQHSTTQQPENGGDDSHDAHNNSFGNGHPSKTVFSQIQSTQSHPLWNPLRLRQIFFIDKPYRIYDPYYPILGLFLFYVGHDALQERMFRFDGFEYGFFMTLVEVLVMLIGSVASSGACNVSKKYSPSSQIEEAKEPKLPESKGKLYSLSSKEHKLKQKVPLYNFLGCALSFPTIVRIAWVGLFLALSHGLGNTALRYSPYPLKVAFKSCKLVPTMALGACVTGRKHTALQYTAALVMGFGLAVLTAADVFTGKYSLNSGDGSADIDGSLKEESNPMDEMKNIGPFLGPILLAISTFFDSIIPNLQEQLLQTAKVKTSEMIFVSNSIMCIVLLSYTLYSGELLSAWNYCIQHKDASSVLILQGMCAYWGLQSYLSIIREHGGVVGVLLANARKIVTIVLSFLLFAKPFNSRHFVGLFLVFVGVYLGYISKKGGRGKDVDGSSGKRRKKTKKKRIDNNKDHEHKV